MRRARDPYRRWDACRGNARVRRQERERAIRPHAVASSHPVVSCPVRLTLYPVRTWTALSRQTPRGVPGLGRINGQIVRRRRHHEYVDPVAQEDLIHLELQRSANDRRVPAGADLRGMRQDEHPSRARLHEYQGPFGSRYAACPHGSVDSGRARAVMSALWLLPVGHMSSHEGICAPP